MIRYGKSSDGLLKLKLDFFINNDHHMEKQRAIAAIYQQQPARTRCKNCNAPLDEADFTLDGTGYTLCRVCGHLNGMHEDTSAFCAAVYSDDGGESYSENYRSDDRDAFDTRVDAIYVPKAEMLRDVLDRRTLSPATLTYADLGAGTGYFVSALKRIGFTNVTGYEVSEAQVARANAMIGAALIRRTELADINNLAAIVNSQVVSLIGVLEHVQHPRALLQALRSNPVVRFVYFSVPLFSPTVYLETAFPSVYHRHLGGAHTHLYTEQSLRHAAQEFGFTSVSEWWFGTDMVDLFRDVFVILSQQGASPTIIDQWRRMFAPVIDTLQLSLDHKHLSSEVHMIWEKCEPS